MSLSFIRMLTWAVWLRRLTRAPLRFVERSAGKGTRPRASHFWWMVSDYLETLDAKNLKVYQDGFVSDGDLGKKIIEEGVRKGSKNYDIILNLLNRGAEVVSTEDIALLQEEYGYISQIIKAETASQRRLVYKGYESRKSQLTMERDTFIARTISETLKDGEVGLLFLGAYHDVIPYLAKDVVVEQLKEREKVKAYFDELMYGSDERSFEQLAGYLNSAGGRWCIISEPKILMIFKDYFYKCLISPCQALAAPS